MTMSSRFDEPQFMRRIAALTLSQIMNADGLQDELTKAAKGF